MRTVKMKVRMKTDEGKTFGGDMDVNVVEGGDTSRAVLEALCDYIKKDNTDMRDAATMWVEYENTNFLFIDFRLLS